MKMQPLTFEDHKAFRKYWKSFKKDVIIDHMEELLMFVVQQATEIETLQKQATVRNTEYLSRCRSSGGVTLPPGV